jgi:acetyl-CoA carboxylase biotin carboxyl carrier protein
VSLTAKDVAEIMRLLEDSSFDELNLEIDGLKLSLKRGAGILAQWGQPPSAAVSPCAAAAPALALQAGPTVAATPAAAVSDIHNVCAPLLGTFFRTPKPGAPPFVEVGSQVQEDSIVGILEVMKLMNTVRADARGTVIEIAARDGALVEYGEVLLRITRTS